MTEKNTPTRYSPALVVKGYTDPYPSMETDKSGSFVDYCEYESLRNHHAQLVAALKECVSTLESAEEAGFRFPVLNTARQALASLEKSQ